MTPATGKRLKVSSSPPNNLEAMTLTWISKPTQFVGQTYTKCQVAGVFPLPLLSSDMLHNTGSSSSGSEFKKTMKMLVARGHMTFITSPPLGEEISLVPGALLSKNLSVSGSAIGFVDEIQYMLDFAAEHKIKPWVECLDMNEENLALAWQRVYNGDVKFRFIMINYKKCFQ